MYTVPGGYLSPRTNDASVLNHDHRLALFLIRAIDAEMNVLANEDRVSKLDSVGQVPSEVPRMVNFYIAPDGREWVGGAHPRTVQCIWDPR